jgi:hypothetical protein
MDRNVVDYTLPVALRALAFAVEELILNQRILDERLRRLEGVASNDHRSTGAELNQSSASGDNP